MLAVFAVDSLQFQIRSRDKFPYFSSKTYIVTPHYNLLVETVLIRGDSVCFQLEIRRINSELSLVPLVEE